MSKNTSVSVLAPVVAVLIVVGIAIPVVIYYAWAFTTLWNWFIPAIFVGLPTLTITQGIALSLVLGMLRVRAIQPKSETPGSDAAVYILAPLLAVSAGYVLKFWVGV